MNREQICTPKRSGTMIELPHQSDANRFLGALGPVEREMLSSHLQLVHLKSGQVLCEPGEQLEHIYLPTTTVISLQYVLSDGMMLEVAQIGDEGLIGRQIMGGNGAIPCRVVTCRDGFSYRLREDLFSQTLDTSAAMRGLVLRCIQLLMMQSAQISFCSRHHLLKNQLCRWLILAYDRSRSVEIKVTHNMLAQMLGARRETVSDAAGEIQKMGLIHQHRSSIILADLHGLDAQACGCHTAIRQEMNRIFPGNIRTLLGLRLGKNA